MQQGESPLEKVKLKGLDESMKKLVSFVLCALLAVTALAGCGGDSSTASGSSGASGTEAVSGTVATDGSTSMQKVIGALGEAFEQANKGVTFT